MSSRYLAAAGAWVLGAAIATTGSVIAANELAHGLLSQPTQQLVGTEARESRAATASSSSSSPSPSVTPTPASGAATDPSATPAVSAAPQAQPGTFLSSPDGSVVASCQSAGAYLQYWSPDPGFQADDVTRGPAAVARVTFEGSAGGVIMRVSCTSGTPAAQLEQLPASGDDGSRSPDE